MNNTTQTPWYRKGNGTPVEDNRGGIRREGDGGRKREGGTLGKENP